MPRIPSGTGLSGVERIDGPEESDDASAAPVAAPPPPASAATPGRAGLPDRMAVLGAVAADPSRAPGAALPEVLLSSAKASVVHGTDPGDFYCEHMFYLSQREATLAGNKISRNAAGEPLVGFLHLPDDPFSGGGGKYTQAARHAGTREVVGAALRGYFEDAAAAGVKDPVKLMLTGYGAFMSIQDNPTGDFVSHAENLDAALAKAFGKDLLSKHGEVVGDAKASKPSGAPEEAGKTLRYRVRDPQTGKERTLDVRLERFPVADSTLDPSSGHSIEGAARAWKPNAILSMGIAGGASYMAEHHADDGSLRERRGHFSHDDARAPERSFADNYSLARAILRGQKPAVASKP